MKPIVTIGVCIRNSASTIREAIESIISQDFSHELMEVIFVDDGSTDRTLCLIMDYISRMDMQVKVFHQEWKGLGPARNVVVKNASGDYIIWVDGDIVLPKDHVCKQVEFMRRHPKTAIAGGSFGIRPQASLVAFLENLAYLTYRLRYGEKSSSMPGTGGAIYRVEAIRQVGGFDENIRGSGEDIDVAYRVKSAGWLVVRDKAVFYGKCKETWRELWNQYLWHGYGAHYVNHKNRGIISLPKMLPPISFFSGIIHSLMAFQLVQRKIVFLFPFHLIFKNIAWWIGFLKSHSRGYGHNMEHIE
jgi:glycosyltransferase involved in cell wall biosynthesis